MHFIQLLLAFLLPYFLIVSAEKLSDLTFEPPFNDVDHAGERIVSKQWRSYGVAAVNTNFVRLTPDRQSKKGALWSRKSIDISSISSILKFRISGQGKQFFGDGLALWIVTQGYYIEGDLHGFQEKFTGIGIIFDTFKNAESIQVHRDVTVLINDGQKTWQMMTETVEGCNINARYHAERADFNVKDSVSLAKFLLTETSLDLFIDAKNTGEWSRCVKIDNLDLPRDWLRHSHIGFTASTGQLADNHDVISLATYSEAYVMEQDIAAKSTAKYYEPLLNTSLEDRLARLERAVDGALEKLDLMDHHVEHELVTVEDGLQNLELKFKRVEAPDQAKIGELIKKEASGISSDFSTFKDRITSLETNLAKLKLSPPVANPAATTTTAAGAATSKPVSDSSWKWPFTLLFLYVLGVSIGAILWYRHVVGKWKLP